MKILILGKIINAGSHDFEAMEQTIKDQGNIPINPVKVMYALPEDISNGDFIAVLIELVRISDAVCLIDGWTSDLGASIAKRNAENFDKKIIEIKS